MLNKELLNDKRAAHGIQLDHRSPAYGDGAIAGLAAGMFLSLIWMVLLRFAAGLMAWAAVLSVNIFCAACTMLAFLKVCLLCILSYTARQSACTVDMNTAHDVSNNNVQAQLDCKQVDCDTDVTKCFAHLC